MRDDDVYLPTIFTHSFQRKRMFKNLTLIVCQHVDTNVTDVPLMYGFGKVQPHLAKRFLILLNIF